MAVTRVQDVVVPEIFNPYVINRTLATSALFKSGLVQTVPELTGVVNRGGVLYHMPFWSSLGGEDEVLKDKDGWGLTPAKISAAQDLATQLFRGKSWAASDLATALAGSNPMTAIGNQVADYWNERMQVTLGAVLKGLFGDNGVLVGTHVNDISVKTGTPTTTNQLSAAGMIDSMSKLGDKFQDIVAIAMHSAGYFELVRQNLIVYEKEADGTTEYPTYLGKRVVVDDDMPILEGTAGTPKRYVSILFAAGAIGYAEGAPEVPTETDRDSLGGVDVMITRKHYILHPRGIAWNGMGKIADLTPSNSELATPTNWNKVYRDKEIKMVALIHN